ncbi:ketoacyl-ACP synthase III family protein [Actinoplanes sp. KI2]|uniref:3-oxoacyl-ACP synthase III family protein n=1 Tax=Actinoplanes sp. KI2 TaxID=2983315 RepID=UPI0021D5C7EF|nr:ketoacyl-ACP synthase III family protein [Actinoplanes sp. KI2]MCU7728506.1 ketoacyl-ACP synthase III family protein [Actinoplanes sp. KI2]
MTGAPAVSLTDVAAYLPGEPVGLDFFTRDPQADDKLRDSAMFKAPRWRHHVAAGETNVDLAERAVQQLIDRHGADEIRSADVLLVHTQLPDLPIVGAGTEIARRLGLRPEWLVDVANAGCASFVHMLQLARQILTTTDATRALICNVQTAAGQLFTQSEVRRLAQSAIPGDACGVGYVTADGPSPVLEVSTRHIGEYAGDMRLVADDGRRYWETRTSQLKIGFTEEAVTAVLARGNRLVPEVVGDLCRRLALSTSDIDVLITNQPNRTFLRNWRQALGLPPERHPDTFDECGNTFGAAIPLTLDRAVRSGQVHPGDLVVLGGFAHAGDFAGAAAVRWQGRH